MESSPKKSDYAKYIILGVALLFVIYVLIFAGLIPTPQSKAVTRWDYVIQSHRNISLYIEKHLKSHECIYPCKEYYGPLTREMLCQLSDSSPTDNDNKNPDSIFYWAIDPFNVAPPEDSILEGPFFGDSRGSPLRIKGHDCYYYTDGREFYIIGSYGPDNDLDLSADEVIAKNPGQAPSRIEASDFDYYLQSKNYDVSNGTFSDGDIMSIDILPLDRWRTNNDSQANNH